MSYNNDKRCQKSNLNKEKILQVAKHLILTKGYDNVSVTEITKEAGVSKGAFYLHFKSKDEIISDLIDVTFKSANELEKNLTAFEGISEYLKKSVKIITDTGLKMAQTWFSDAVKPSVYGIQKLKYDEDKIKNILLKEKSAEESKILAKKIVSMYYGILVRWCIDDGMTDPNEEISLFIECEIKKMF